MNNYIKEACVGSLEEALEAERKGADRIELCANLHVGGTTPSQELIMEAAEKLKIPIRVMIRPRGGDFVYTSNELNQMVASIEYCKNVGVEGVVFGILNADNTLNLKEISKLANIAKPLKVVVHKAIDETPEPLEALRKLTKIDGITTILTSGGAKTAFEGKETLMEMIEVSENRLEIMPAGKITNNNILDLHHRLGASAYHGKGIVGKL